MKTIYICSTREQAERVAKEKSTDKLKPLNITIEKIRKPYEREAKTRYVVHEGKDFNITYDKVEFIEEQPTYQQLAHRTLNYLETDQMNAIHMLLGLGSEVGELMDAYKKSIAYGQELDLTNVIEELGDVKFYISNFCTLLNIDEDMVGHKNIEKLKARYPDKFSEEKAANRDLETERNILEK